MTSEYPRPIPEQCLETGEQCAPCPYILDDSQAAVCGYLRIGAEARRSRELLEEAGYDSLIPEFRTPLGVRLMIGRDPEFAAQLLAGTVCVYVVDLRGVKALNDSLGDDQGDRLMVHAGARMLALRRHRFDEVGPGGENRETIDHLLDFCTRSSKADELVIIKPRMPDEVAARKVAKERIAPMFSIDRAIEDSRTGGIPIVGHVGYAYAASADLSLPDYAEMSIRQRAEMATDVYDATLSRAKAYLHDRKDRQYDSMRAKIAECYAAQGQDLDTITLPRDKRMIVEKFWEVCCPEFTQDAVPRLSQPAVR
jgi:GGDEF domain-containing protein